MIKVYFKNGINGVQQDWTEYNARPDNECGVAKRSIESNVSGEAGLVIFDEVSLAMLCESGSPVYTALRGSLSSADKFIITLCAIEEETRQETPYFEGIIDFKSIQEYDGENIIKFNVVDKMSAFNSLTTDRLQRGGLSDAAADRAGITQDYAVNFYYGFLAGIGYCHLISLYEIVEGEIGGLIDQTTPCLLAGDTFRHPSTSRMDELFFVKDSGIYGSRTWIKIHRNPAASLVLDLLSSNDVIDNQEASNDIVLNTDAFAVNDYIFLENGSQTEKIKIIASPESYAFYDVATLPAAGTENVIYWAADEQKYYVYKDSTWVFAGDKDAEFYTYHIRRYTEQEVIATQMDWGRDTLVYKEENNITGDNTAIFASCLYYYAKDYYDIEDICLYEVDSYSRSIIKAFDALKIIEGIIKGAWSDATIVNNSGYSEYPLSLSYYNQLIYGSPFDADPYSALKMLADSMRCYMYFDRQGRFVLQGKAAIPDTTLRSYTGTKFPGSNIRDFWQQVVDGVTVTVKTGIDIDGTELTGFAKKVLTADVNIEPRNALEVEIFAPSTVALTQLSLDNYADEVADELINFYGKCRKAYTLYAPLNDDILGWEITDRLTINGVEYFFISIEIDPFSFIVYADLVAVSGTAYIAGNVLIPKKEKTSSSTTTVKTTNIINSGSGSYTAEYPLTIEGSVISIAYEDNLELSEDNKLNTVQNIKTTSSVQFGNIGIGAATDSTHIALISGAARIESLGVGGDAVSSYKAKIYGAAHITGSLTIDGDIYINGAINQVDVTTLDVADKIINLNKGGTSSTAIGAGVQVLGSSDAVVASMLYDSNGNFAFDKTVNLAAGLAFKINNVSVLNATTLGSSVIYSSLTTLGTIAQNLNLVTGYAFTINSVSVLSATTLGSSVVNSSLTSVGTLTTGVWNATAINAGYLNYNTTHFTNASNKLAANNITLSSNNGVVFSTSSVTLGGSVTISTAQDIQTTASPSFVGITLSGGGLTAGSNLTITLAGSGYSILPYLNYGYNFGSLSKKFLSVYAAELWVETLVAQNTKATIGGRVLVGETNILSADLASAATTIYFKYNSFASGDTIYMEADGKIEFMLITAGPSGSAGNYSYTVTRNVDGSGANEWYAGDAAFNTGAAGDGFIDLYSVRGVKSSSQAGPTIVGNVRNSATYNDWTEHWAIGNLKGLYGYEANTYGIALGRYGLESSYITADATNGVCIKNRYDDGTEVTVIKLAQDGTGYLGGGAIAWGGYQDVTIAGFNVDTAKFYGAYSGVYVGMQKIASSSTKCFFAGANSNVGAGARFYVQGDGTVVTTDISGNILFDSNTVYYDAKNIGRVFYSSNTVLSTAATSYTTIASGTLFLLENETTVQAVFRSWIEGSTSGYGSVRLYLTPIVTAPASNSEIGNYSATSATSSIQDVGDGNTSCFNPDTTFVTMADGTKRKLRYLRVNDKVKSYDPETRQFGISSIGGIRKARAQQVYRIKIPNSRRETLVTGEHPLYTTKGWMQVKNITTEKVLVENKIYLPIIKSELKCALDTWTLSMSRGERNFIANGFIAHNKGTANAYAQFGVCKITSGLTTLRFYKWELKAFAPSASYPLKLDNLSVTSGRSAFSQTEVKIGY